MLWRVRTTLADRPGALAELSTRCGEQGVNILGLQIFPGVDTVTDELVLNAPPEWGMADIAAMVESAGGRQVSVAVCTAHALTDGPTHYLQAVRRVSEDPASVAEVLADLLGGDVVQGEFAEVQSVLEVPLGSSSIRVHRAAPFTATETARARAFAAAVTDLLVPEPTPLGSLDKPRLVVLPAPDASLTFRVAATRDADALVRMADRCSTDTLAARFGVPLTGLQPRVARRILADGPALVVEADGEIVALASLSTAAAAEVSLIVEDGWQGRGVGARLLALSARLAKSHGAADLVLSSRYNNDVVPRLSAASGLTGRVRHDNGRVVLTVSLRRVAPLLEDVGGAVGLRPLDPAPA